MIRGICDWLFRRKPAESESDEAVLVEFGGAFHRRPVLRDADGRPYVLIFRDTAVRLDVTSYREIIWIKRRPPAPTPPVQEKR